MTRTMMRTAAALACLVLAACGGSSKTARDYGTTDEGGEGTVLPDGVTDVPPVDVPDGVDVTPADGDVADPGVPDGVDVPDVGGDDGVVNPDVEDADVPPNPDVEDADVTVPPDGDDVPVDVPGDTAEVDVAPPECPCKDDVPDAQVCGTKDKSTAFQTFVNDQCAKCEICSDCVGCNPNGKVCNNDPNEWILYKGECGKCKCDPKSKCEDIGYTACGQVCGTKKDASQATFGDVCALIHEHDCDGWADGGWQSFIVNYGACVEVCDPCAGQPEDPVCGKTAGGVYKTYRSYCHMMSAGGAGCPGEAGTLQYLGACLGADFCQQCASADKVEVCGKDGVTYANECAATTCAATTFRPGRCCPECIGDPGAETCGVDGVLYDNWCTMTGCLGIDECGDTLEGTGVCGKDGKTYPNSCQAQCFGKGVYDTKPCSGLCPQCERTLAPKCGHIGAEKRSFQNQCFADCLGGTVDSDGLCTTGCTSICGTLEAPNTDSAYTAPACGEDKITYPTSCFPQKCFGGISFTAGTCQ